MVQNGTAVLLHTKCLTLTTISDAQAEPSLGCSPTGTRTLKSLAKYLKLGHILGHIEYTFRYIHNDSDWKRHTVYRQSSHHCTAKKSPVSRYFLLDKLMKHLSWDSPSNTFTEGKDKDSLEIENVGHSVYVLFLYMSNNSFNESQKPFSSSSSLSSSSVVVYL